MIVELEPFSLPLARPLKTAHGTISAREGFLVTVETDLFRGLGEATPLPGWTEAREECRAALEGIEDPEATLEECVCTSDDASQAVALDGVPAARHGLTLAMADARARAADVPLYRHLGGEVPVETVPVNATVGDASPGETAREVKQAVAHGFPAVKVKVGARPVVEDIERLRAVRELAPDVELRADANGAWTREAAAEVLTALVDLNVAYVEQPLPPDDLAGHADLRGGGVDVAIDEGVSVNGVDAVLAADAADVLIVKPMVLGGPDRARQAAVRAREAGLSAVVTTTLDGAVARAGAAHVAASLHDPPACGLATADRLTVDLLPDPVPVMDGAAYVPQSPGNVEGSSDER